MTLKDEPISMESYMDLSLMAMGLASYREALGYDGTATQKQQALFNDGLHLYKLLAPTHQKGYEDRIASLKDVHFFKLLVRDYEKNIRTGQFFEHFAETNAFLLRLFPLMLTKFKQVEDRFESGDRGRLNGLNRVASEEDPRARMRLIVLSKNLNARVKNWCKAAAVLLDLQISEMELAIADAEAATDLGQQIQTVAAKSQLATPNSPEQQDLEIEKEILLNQVEEVAMGSSNPDLVRLISAQGAVLDPNYAQVTKTGRLIKALPSQEKAMMAEGRVIIAAGAGSGKTLTLAGKVAYHINEKGVPVERVIATSFSAKSAAELKGRIQKYGVPLNKYTPNMGTTHSLGKAILQEFDPSFNREIISTRESTMIMRMAMAQVTLRPERGAAVTPPDPEESLLPAYGSAAGATFAEPAAPKKPRTPRKKKEPEVPVEVPVEDPAFLNAIREARSYFGWMSGEVKGFPMGRRWDGMRRVFKHPDRVLDFMDQVQAKGLSGLSDIDKDDLNHIWATMTAKGNPMVTYRVASDEQWENLAFLFAKEASVETRLHAQNKARKIAKIAAEDDEFMSEFMKFAAGGDDTGEDNVSEDGSPALDENGNPKGKDPLLDSKWWKTPANQWFNLGWPVVRQEGGQTQAIGPKLLNTEISKADGDLVAPGALWAQAGIDMNEVNGGYAYRAAKKNELLDGETAPPFEGLVAACYAAYQYIKHNDVSTQNRIDFSDMLIKSTAMLIAKPKALKALNDRYQVILVDEAQDLNKAQHTMFGLIAGYIDPKTLKPYGDGRMTAKTFAYVGDDKQSIYAFRGASPQNFIDKSDLFAGGSGDFQTYLLETNFRSGGRIVGAANNLIAHNVEKQGELTRYLQIPMVCNVAPKAEGQGDIEAVRLDDSKACASYAADSIAQMVQGPDATEDLGRDGEHPTFGIALRTNGEAFSFCAELAKKGIPFRSKVNLFNNPTTKTLMAYLDLATSNDTAKINHAVLTLHTAPNFMLGQGFSRVLKKRAQGNYYDYLVGGGWRNLLPVKGGWDRNTDVVLPYVENLIKVRETLSKVGPKEFIQGIKDLEGPSGVSFIESLKKDIRSNMDLMDKLAEESTEKHGRVSEEEIEALALEPIETLIEILQSHGDVRNAMAYIEKLKKANAKQAKDDNNGDNPEPAVLVGTVHGWKGLECKHLFTVMGEGIFPSSRTVKASENDPAAMYEERRLAYVTLTRGQDSVTVLAPRINKFGKPCSPSRFISEACIPGITQTPGEADENAGKLASLEDMWKQLDSKLTED